jgi:hypothetical protein
MSGNDSGSSSTGCGCLGCIFQIIFFSLLIYFSKDWSDWFWALSWNAVGFIFLKILFQVVVGIICQFAIDYCIKNFVFDGRSNLLAILGIILPFLLIPGQIYLSYILFPDAWNWFYAVVKSWFG